MGGTLIKMNNISKYFSGIPAIKNCDFELKAGEVHALIGENGAGKSTLMKILNGIHKEDEGYIECRGQRVDFMTPHDAQRAGIAMIHQELNLISHLTVAENVFINREIRAGIFLKQDEMNVETEKLLKSLALDMKPTDRVMNLTVAKQQMVEIAKTIYTNAEVIVMDEPTAALSESEIKEIFEFIKKLKADGKGVIYISHRMEELFAISDRITVMRDGEYIDTLNTKETNVDHIIKLMVGREIIDNLKEQSTVAENAPVVLEVKELNSKDVIDISFELRKGEILGVAGLMGAGRTEMARLIFGADKMNSGEIIVNDKKVSIKSSRNAIKHGIGYLSEDRKRFGLAVGRTVVENITLTALREFTKYGFINKRKEIVSANELIKKLNVKTQSCHQTVRKLSGGNQQKIVLAKWLLQNCEILIFDEPTRGIDIGAKSEIYILMNNLVKQGKSIIVISSELNELLSVSDRVMVMREGRITGVLNIEEADQERVMYFATLKGENKND